MIRAGYSYTLCLEVVGEKNYTCTIIRSDGTSVTLTEASANNITTDKYFGLCAWGGAVTGKLTNVKCYDNKGNDYGVWGNEEYGVIVPGNEIEEPTYTEYEVIINNAAVLSVFNNEEVAFTEGDKYYMSYTVETLSTTNTGTTFRSGIQTATADGKTGQYPYTTGVLQYYDKTSISGSMVEPGYSYTICVEVTANGNKYTVTRSDEMNVTSFTSVVTSTSDQRYFGLCVYPGNISGKLTNVKCYDGKGNDLGVWGNPAYGATIPGDETEEPTYTEYEVEMDYSAKVFVTNNTAVDFAIGDKYYLTYTVESLSTAASTLRTGVSTTTDRSAEYPYLSGVFRFIDKTSANQAETIAEVGSTYTICIEVTASGRNYTVSKDGGQTVTLGNPVGTNTAGTTHFGLWLSSEISGKLVNVKCYDAEGNDLGVWGNESYGVTVYEEGNAPDVEETVETIEGLGLTKVELEKDFDLPDGVYEASVDTKNNLTPCLTTGYNYAGSSLSGKYLDVNIKMEGDFTTTNYTYANAGQRPGSLGGFNYAGIGGSNWNAAGGLRVQIANGVLKIYDPTTPADCMNITSTKANIDLAAEQFNLKLGTIVDDLNDDGKGDLQVYVWINDLYCGTYEYKHMYNSAGSTEIGNYCGIYLVVGGQKLEITTPGKKDVKQEEIDKNFRVITFANFKLADGTYTYNENGKPILEVGKCAISLNRTVFTGDVVFSSVLGGDMRYGGAKKDGHGLRFWSSGGNLYMTDATGHTDTYTFLSAVAGVKLADNQFNLKISTEFVDSDGDGRDDDVKLGVWFNDKLYRNNYIFLQDYRQYLGKYAFAYSSKDGSYMTIKSVAGVDTGVDYTIFGFNDDWRKEFGLE